MRPRDAVGRKQADAATPLVDLNLSFRPQADAIYSLCELVVRLCGPYVTDLDAISRIRLAAHELLENLIKYALDQNGNFALFIADGPSGRTIRVATVNRAAPESVREVRARLDALNTAPDPIAHYDAVIMDSLRRSAGSGLGLARIKAEGEMRLDYAIDNDNVTIASETTISNKGFAMLDLASVTTPEFSSASTYDAGVLSVEFSGKGDMNAITLLSDYLKQVHSEANRLSANEVVCDFRKLSFMNSSCFKAFVVWIDTVKNQADPYRIRFLTDQTLHWQRRSLEALRRLAANVVSIDND